MQTIIKASTEKTASNALKTIRKQIDESLKSICGGSGVSDSGHPKRFFLAKTTIIFAIENQVASEIMLTIIICIT